METNYSFTIKFMFRVKQIIWSFLAILEILLAFRFFLKFFGASTSAGFTDFIYRTTYIFIAPFLNMFSITYVDGNVFAWSTLLAMFVYWLLAVTIIKLLIMSRAISANEAERRLDE